MLDKNAMLILGADGTGAGAGAKRGIVPQTAGSRELAHPGAGRGRSMKGGQIRFAVAIARTEEGMPGNSAMRTAAKGGTTGQVPVPPPAADQT